MRGLVNGVVLAGLIWLAFFGVLKACGVMR